MKSTPTRPTLRNNAPRERSGADSYDFALAVWADDGGAIKSRITDQAERIRSYMNRKRKSLALRNQRFTDMR